MTHDSLNAEAERLRALIGQHETATALQTVEAGLASKFEGIQSLAAQVLGGWRSEHSKRRLREWLEAKLDQRVSSSVGVAARALRSRVTAEDASWLLDLYFKTTDVANRHALLSPLELLPAECLTGRIERELGSHNPANRDAAVALRNRLRSRANPPQHC